MHSLYTGVTQSGKTTLARFVARQLAPELRKAKRRQIVYDPLGTGTKGGDWGEYAQVFEEIDPFMELMHDPSFMDADIYIDEAHHIFSHELKENLWLLTQGRHYGYRINLLTQRPTKVHPDARTNCGRCYMFRLAQDDARAIGADYGHSDIHKISLDKGDFLVLDSGCAKYSRANVFNLLES